MYARGMSTRDIQGHLEEMYGVEVSPALISQVTDSVIEEVRAWQNRPLEPRSVKIPVGNVPCTDRYDVRS
jgi:putative transposase